MKYLSLGNEIFLLESHLKNTQIIYAPLKRRFFYTKDVEAVEIEKSFKNDRYHTDLDKRISDLISTQDAKIKKYYGFGMEKRHTVFILTEACNLACSYCYAHEQHSAETLTKVKLKNTIDYILSSGTRGKHFSFIGGGEPCVKWELLVWAVEYIRKQQKDQKVSISLTTNTTLLNAERIQWLVKNQVHIGCSFDILPEIQNIQRPYPSGKGSFVDVKNSIDLLVENGADFGFRTTITKAAIAKMPEMVEYVSNNYQKIRKIHLELVTMPGLTWENYYQAFMNYFFKAKAVAKRKNIYLKNSVINSTQSVRNRFCGGEFCVTPSGDIVACHRNSNDRALAFEQLKYGVVSNDGVLIDETKMKSVGDLYEQKRLMECETCFAKYHCNSQCCSNKLAYSDDDFAELCNFTKEMILCELEERANLSV